MTLPDSGFVNMSKIQNGCSRSHFFSGIFTSFVLTGSMCVCRYIKKESCVFIHIFFPFNSVSSVKRRKESKLSS